MNRLKEFQTSDLKYISKKRREEIEQVFNTLGLMNQSNLPNYSYPSDGYNMPFKQFSVLENKKIIFSSSS